ncbi:Uncharacterised protein [Serratia proteamaculans]|nr:Uncharacterised protein [Serratia proteamaculans]
MQTQRAPAVPGTHAPCHVQPGRLVPQYGVTAAHEAREAFAVDIQVFRPRVGGQIAAGGRFDVHQVDQQAVRPFARFAHGHDCHIQVADNVSKIRFHERTAGTAITNVATDTRPPQVGSSAKLPGVAIRHRRERG